MDVPFSEMYDKTSSAEFALLIDLDWLLAPPADHFGAGGEDEDRADRDLLEGVVDAQDVEPVLDDGDEQHPEEGALHRPHPPRMLVPPRITAAVANSVRLVPTVGCPACTRAVSSTPARPPQPPAMTKLASRTPATGMPERKAASRPPPEANTRMPKFVRQHDAADQEQPEHEPHQGLQSEEFVVASAANAGGDRDRHTVVEPQRESGADGPVPRVATNAGTPSIADSRPLTRPMNMPHSRPTTTPSGRPGLDDDEGGDDPRQRDVEPDRQVEVTTDDHERGTDRDDAEHRALQQDLADVPAGEEER